MRMTVSTTRQQKAEKGKIRCKLRNFRITFKEIEERSVGLKEDGTGYHYNTITAAFDKENKYYNKDLIELAERMIEEKKKGKLIANN